MSRELIVVDFETTGLHEEAVIIEAAAVNVDTGEELYFVPSVSPQGWSNLQPVALSINGYFERELWKQAQSPFNTIQYYSDLRSMLRGNTFAGSNPAFDSKLLAKQGQVSWHHRLGDLAAYAAGVLGLDPTDLPGLDKVSELLGVPVEGRHGALEDARATAECFRILRSYGGGH